MLYLSAYNIHNDALLQNSLEVSDTVNAATSQLLVGHIGEPKEILMQSYTPRVLDRRLQEDWARAAKEGLRVLMNLRVDFLAHRPSWVYSFL